MEQVEAGGKAASKRSWKGTPQHAESQPIYRRTTAPQINVINWSKELFSSQNILTKDPSTKVCKKTKKRNRQKS